MSADNIKVAIKARPLIRRERDSKQLNQWTIKDNTIQHVENVMDKFTFEHIFDENTSTQQLFDEIAKPIVHATMKGFNGTICAYGQTSSGKTHTMLGNEEEPGIMVLAVREMFKEIESTDDREFLIRVAYIEIYNEKLIDLLDKDNVQIKIESSSSRGDVNVTHKEFIVQSEESIMNFMEMGNKTRKIAETNMNERSSRSHTIFRFIVESADLPNDNEDRVFKKSILNLVDLAGSERADQTGACGSRLKEGGHINKSLLSLSCVIQKLSENALDTYVNYRDSKLTRILQASLGGNALTGIICTITTAALEETNSTLSFASRAKCIKNKPVVNEVINDADLMKKMKRETNILRQELEEEKHKSEEIQQKLKRQIIELESKFVKSKNTSTQNKERRRTWCPSFNNQCDDTLMPPPSNIPRSILRKTEYEIQIDDEEFGDFNEQFELPNDFSDTNLINTKRGDFDTVRCASPSSKNRLSLLMNDNLIISTPKAFKTPKTTADPYDDSPINRHFNNQIRRAENELDDLKQFTLLEKKLLCPTDTDAELELKRLQTELELAHEQIKVFQKEHVELLAYRLLGNNSNESVNKSVSSNFSQLEFEIEELRSKLDEMDTLQQRDKQTIHQLNNDLKTATESSKLSDMQKTSLEFEYEQFKNKSKNREKELIEALDNRSSGDASVYKIEKLEEMLKQVEKTNWLISEENASLKADNNELLKKCKSNEMIIKEENDCCLQKVSQLDRYIEEISSLKKQIQELESQSKDALANYNKIKEEHSSVCSERDKLMAEYDELSAQLMDNVQDNDSLKKCIETMTTENAELKTDAEKLNAQWLQLTQDNDNFKIALQSLNKMIEEEREQFLKLEKENSQIKQNYQLLEMEKVELVDKLQQLDAEMRIKEEQMLDNAVKLDSLSKKLSVFEPYKVRNEILEISNKELELKLENVNNVYQQQTNELRQKEKEIQEIINLEQFSTIKNEKLQTELETVQSEVADKVLQIQQLTFTLENLVDFKKGASDKEDYISTLQTQLETVQSEVTEKEMQIQQLTKHLSELETKLQNIEKENSGKEVQIQELTNKLDSSSGLQIELDGKLAQIQQYKSELETFHNLEAVQLESYAELESKLEIIQTELTEKKLQIQQLTVQLECIAELESKLEAIQHEVTDKDVQIHDFTKKLEQFVDLQSQLEIAQSEVVGKESQIQQLTIKLENIAEFEKGVTEKVVHIEKLQTQLETVQIEMVEKETQIQQLQTQLETVQSEMTDKVMQIQQLKSELAIIAQSKETIVFENQAELGKKLETIQMELDYKNSQIQQLTIKLQNLAEFEQKLTEKEVDIERLQTQLKTVQCEVDEKESQIQQLQTQLETGQSEVADKVIEIQQLQTVQCEVDEKESQIQQLHTQLETVQCEVVEKETQIQQLQKQLETVQCEVVEKETQIQHLITKLNQTVSIEVSEPKQLQLQTDLETVQNEVMSKVMQIQQLESKLKELTELQSESVQTEVNDKNVQSQQKLSNELENIEVLQAELDTVRNEVAAKDSLIQQLQIRLDNFDNQVDDNNLSNKEIEQMKNLEKCDGDEQQILDVSSKLLEAKREYERNINDLENQIHELQTEREENNKFLELITMEKVELEEKCRNLQLNGMDLSFQAPQALSETDFSDYLNKILSESVPLTETPDLYRKNIIYLEKILQLEEFIQNLKLKTINLSESIEQESQNNSDDLDSLQRQFHDLNDKVQGILSVAQCDRLKCEISEKADEIQQLSTLIENLEDKLKLNDEKLTVLTSLQDQLNDNENKLKLNEETINELENVIEKLQKSIELNENNAKDLQNSINTMLTDRSEESRKSQQNFENLQIKFSNTERELDALKQEHAELCNQKNELFKIVENNRLVMQQTEDDCSSIQMNYRECMESIQKLQEENVELKNQQESHKDELKNVTESMESTSESLQIKMRELEECNLRCEQLSAKVATLEQENEIISENLTKEIHLLERKITDLLASIENLQQVEASQEKLIDELRTQIHDLETELEAVTQEKEAGRKECNQLQASHHELIKNVSDLSMKIGCMENENSLLKSSSNKITELATKVDCLEVENNSLKSEIQKLEQQLLQSETNLNNLNLATQTSTSQLHLLNDHINEHITTIDSLRQELHVLKKEQQNAKVQIAELDELSVILKYENESFKHECGQKKEELEQVNVKYQQCNDNYRILKDEFNKLKTEYINLDAIQAASLCDVNNKSYEIETLKKQKSQLTEQLKAFYQIDLDKLREEFNNTNKLYQVQLKENKNYEQHVANIEAKVRVLAEQLKDSQQQCAKLMEQLTKCSTIDADYHKLKEQFDVENSEKENLMRELNQLKKMHIFKVSQYESDISELNDRLKEFNKKPSTGTPEKEKQINELKSKLVQVLKEKKEENSKNQHLRLEIDGLRNSMKSDRKSRRHSVHDEKRLSSMFDDSSIKTHHAAVQTMPTDTACSCAKMDNDIKELKRKIMIQECQIGALKLQDENHPLRGENEDLRKLLRECDNEKQKLRLDIKKANLKLQQSFSMPTCPSCVQLKSKLFQSNSCQTDPEPKTITMSACGSGLVTEVENLQLKDKLTILMTKYDRLKQMLRGRLEEIGTLQEEIKRLKLQSNLSATTGSCAKENSPLNPLQIRKNVPFSSHNGLESENSALKSDLTKAQETIVMLKKLNATSNSSTTQNGKNFVDCAQKSSQTEYYNLNNDEENRLRKIIDDMEEELRIKCEKYEKIKTIIISRNRQIQHLESKLQMNK